MVVALARHFAPAAPAWPPRLRDVPTDRLGVVAAGARRSRTAQGGQVPPAQCRPTVVNSTPVHRRQKRVRFAPATRTRTFPRTPQCLKRVLWQDAEEKETATRESRGCPHLREVRCRVPHLALLERQRRGRSTPCQERIRHAGILRAPGDRRYDPCLWAGDHDTSSGATTAGSNRRRQPGRAGSARSEHQVPRPGMPTAVLAVTRPGTQESAAAIEPEGAPTEDCAASPAAATAESNPRRHQDRAGPACSKPQVSHRRMPEAALAVARPGTQRPAANDRRVGGTTMPAEDGSGTLRPEAQVFVPRCPHCPEAVAPEEEGTAEASQRRECPTVPSAGPGTQRPAANDRRERGATLPAREGSGILRPEAQVFVPRCLHCPEAVALEEKGTAEAPQCRECPTAPSAGPLPGSLSLSTPQVKSVVENIHSSAMSRKSNRDDPLQNFPGPPDSINRGTGGGNPQPTGTEQQQGRSARNRRNRRRRAARRALCESASTATAAAEGDAAREGTLAAEASVGQPRQASCPRPSRRPPKDNRTDGPAAASANALFAVPSGGCETLRGISYQVVPCRGNGNCFFEAASIATYGDEGKDPRQLRRAACQWMVRNQQLVEAFFTTEQRAAESALQRAVRLTWQGEYADQSEVMAVAHLTGRSFLVYDLSRDTILRLGQEQDDGYVTPLCSVSATHTTRRQHTMTSLCQTLAAAAA